MDIVQISPLTLTFRVPEDLQRTLTFSNLTLRSVQLLMIPSHPQQLSIEPSSALIKAFEELKVKVILCWSQSSVNNARGKVRVVISQRYDIESTATLQELFLEDQPPLYQDIALQCMFDPTLARAPLLTQNYYKLTRILEIPLLSAEQEHVIKELFQQIEAIGNIKFILPSQLKHTWFIQFQNKQDLQTLFFNPCVGKRKDLFAFAPVVQSISHPPTPSLVSFGQEQKQTNSLHLIQNQSFFHQQATKHKSSLQQKCTFNELQNQQRIYQSQNTSNQSPKYKVQNLPIRKQIVSMKEGKNHKQGIQRQRQKIITVQKQVIIQLNERVLNVLVSEDKIFVLLCSSLKCYSVKDMSTKIDFHFDKIEMDKVALNTPMDIFKSEQVVFANECYLYWVNLRSGLSQWNYVQRKEIYTLAAINSIGVVAVGGKNFSKLHYLGKGTSRANIKLYGTAKHDHLLTYDFPADNIGCVKHLLYLTKIDLLLAHTQSPQGKCRLFFLKVINSTTIEVHGLFDVEEMGITRLTQLKQEGGMVLCMEEIASKDCMKQLKIRTQGEHVDIQTEGIKIAPGKYFGFQTSFYEGVLWVTLLDVAQRNIQIHQIGSGLAHSFVSPLGVIQAYSMLGAKFLLFRKDTCLILKTISNQSNSI